MFTLSRTVQQTERLLLLQPKHQDEQAKHLCFGVKVITQLSATAIGRLSCPVLTMLLCVLLCLHADSFSSAGGSSMAS